MEENIAINLLKERATLLRRVIPTVESEVAKLEKFALEQWEQNKNEAQFKAKHLGQLRCDLEAIDRSISHIESAEKRIAIYGKEVVL